MSLMLYAVCTYAVKHLTDCIVLSLDSPFSLFLTGLGLVRGEENDVTLMY